MDDRGDVLATLAGLGFAEDDATRSPTTSSTPRRAGSAGTA